MVSQVAAECGRKNRGALGIVRQRSPHAPRDDLLTRSVRTTLRTVLPVMASSFKQMPGSSAADFPMAEQFLGDQFHRQPAPLVGKKVFGLGQQTALEPFGSAFACPLLSQSTHILLIA